MKVLVTGGAGFIGVNLARLYGSDLQLVAYDNLSTGKVEDAVQNGFSEIVVGDIRDTDALAKAAKGCDAVVHLAAQTGVPSSLANPRLDLELNVIGTFNVLQASLANDVDRVVLASSAAPLGASAPPASEDVVPRPLSPYGASKLASEAYASAFAGSFGLSTYALRFSNVYGPWSYAKGSVVATWSRQLLAGEGIAINGDGLQTRDFVHVDDICTALYLSLTGNASPGLYQLGTGVETSVADLAARLVALYGADAAAIRYAPALAGEIQRSYCDISKARSELGYNPSVDLSQGLPGTRRWFEEHGH